MSQYRNYRGFMYRELYRSATTVYVKSYAPDWWHYHTVRTIPVEDWDA